MPLRCPTVANNWRNPGTWSMETQHKTKYVLFVVGLALAAVLVAFAGRSLTHHHTNNPAASPTPATASGKKTQPPASPLPSYEPPVYPLEAKTNNQQGAKTFLEYFIDELNYAGWTGDLTEFKKLYDGENCRSCQAFQTLIQNQNDQHLKLYKGAYQIDSVSFTQQPKPDAYQGVFTINREEAGEIDRHGQLSGSMESPIMNQEITFYIEWASGDFTMRYIAASKK